MTSLISPKDFTSVTHQMRSFFLEKGFLEVHTQNRLSILAACEDPTTVTTYEYAEQIWPLPQTGQMWLEYELLTNPSIPGCFCVSTSYRQEENPISGRHELIFPMFEFEMHGGVDDLKQMEIELCEHLGNIHQIIPEYISYFCGEGTEMRDSHPVRKALPLHSIV